MPEFDLDAALSHSASTHLAEHPSEPRYAAVWCRHAAGEEWSLVGSVEQDDPPLWCITAVYANGECPRYLVQELTSAVGTADRDAAVDALVNLWQMHPASFDYKSKDAVEQFRPPLDHA